MVIRTGFGGLSDHSLQKGKGTFAKVPFNP